MIRTLRAGLLTSVVFASSSFAAAAHAQSTGPKTESQAVQVDSAQQASPTAVPAVEGPAGAAVATPAQAAPATNPAGQIVITGSRIARKDFTSQSPIVTVQQEALVANSGITVERGLNELPQVVPSQSETSNDPGTTNTRGGQARVNLRGLGAARTLVLLDGRRLQPSGEDNSVDVTSIPQALIRNVELITGGASAVYGSDAISGVVNFGLNHSFTGIEVDAKYGNTEKWDGETKQLFVTVGNKFGNDRGHFAISAGYADRSKLLGADRDFFATSTISGTLDLVVVPSSTTTRYSQSAINSVFAAYGVAPGTVTNANGFGINPNGTLFSTGRVLTNFLPATYPGDPTSRYVTRPQDVRYISGLDNLIRTPQKRWSVFAMADYEINDFIKPFLNFNYITYKTVTQLNPIGANANVGLTVSPNNVFIPSALKTLLNSRTNPNASFVITKRLVELGSRVQNYTHNTFQLTGGFTGQLPVKDWTYELYGSYGRDNVTNLLGGYASVNAYNNLLGAADGGQSICAGGYNPFNPSFVLSGPCRSYLERTLHIDQQLEQKDGALNIQGGLFNLPAGELRFAAGVNARSNGYEYDPDDTIKQGDAANFAQTFSTTGKTTVKEAFAELLIPVLKDLPGVKSLNVGPAYRISDYNTVGTVSTYKVNADWEVAGGLMLRGGLQRAIRAPSVGELYSPAVSQLNAITADANGKTDPCDIGSVARTGANAAKVRALCLAQGLDPALIDTYTTNQNNALATTSGNPNLKEETADSYTLGGVWRSPFSAPLLRRLTFTVDYYNIKVKDAVGRLTLPQLFQFCFNSNGTTNPNFDPANSYCATLHRDARTGNLSSATLIPNFNLATIKTSGIDFQIDYGFNLADLFRSAPGRFNFNLVGTRLLHFKFTPLAGQDALDYAGSISAAPGLIDGQAIPKLKMELNTSYGVGPFDIGAKVRYIGKMKDQSRVANPASTTPGVKAYTYLDLTAGYKLNDALGLRLGVTNVFDKKPPIVTGVAGLTDPSTYDILGRSYWAQVVFRYK